MSSSRSSHAFFSITTITAAALSALLCSFPGISHAGEDKAKEDKAAKEAKAKEEQAKKDAIDFPLQPAVPYLSVEEQLKTFQLPEGYRLEPVLTEAHIKEPVVCAFDGNGRLFVCEMRTYMQEIDGKNQHSPHGVVSRHESTKGDGVFDKHTIFQDELVLPRMVLPLDDRVLINVTDTNDIKMYRDKNGDGVADEETEFFVGGPRGGNLEHQPSGLVWALDNGMYTAGNNYRLKWDNGKALKEPAASNGGQWGCAQDDFGKVWFSNGGGERGFIAFQTHIQYAGINLPDQVKPGFMEVFPLVPIPDVQGGKSRFRPDAKTLNHFTASCGHTIFRGDRLPEDMRGDAFIPEPVGRLIRRAKVENKEGMIVLSHPYQDEKSEFIRSTDPNFRPVNMTTGPDGCLYICDMYRGIIQEGNWTREGSYHPAVQPRQERRPRPHLAVGSQRFQARPAAAHAGRNARAARQASRTPQRLVARHGAEAADSEGRQVGRSRSGADGAQQQ
jgi:glucose/arabinose dehydrogenase